jgi:hypothetical protein
MWGENRVLTDIRPDELYDGDFVDAHVIDDLGYVVWDSSVSERRSSRHTFLHSPC